MPLHPDFIKIRNSFVKQHGRDRGISLFFSFVNKHNLDDTKPFPKGRNISTKEMDVKPSYYEKLEFKENEDTGDFFSEGYVATTHPDGALTSEKKGDILSEKVIDKIVDSINNSNATIRIGDGKFPSSVAGAVSIQHDWIKERNENLEPAAKAIRAEKRELPGGNFGAWVKTEHNKFHPKFDEIKYKVQKGYFPGYSLEMDKAQGSLIGVQGDTYRFVQDLDFIGYGFAGMRAISNPAAKIINFGYKEVENLFFLNDGKNKISKMEIKTKTITSSNTKNNKIEVKEMENKDDNAKPADAPAEDEGAEVKEEKPEKPAEGGDETPEEPASEDKDKKEEKSEDADSEDKDSEETKEHKVTPEQWNKLQTIETKEHEDAFTKQVKDAVALEIKNIPAGNTPLLGNPVETVEIKEHDNYFKAIENSDGKTTTAQQYHAANAIVNKYPQIFNRSMMSGGMVEMRTSPKPWHINDNGQIECKTESLKSRMETVEVKALTTTTNAEATYFQASAELNDVYDPVIYSHINDQVTTWNMLVKDDFSGRQKVQFRVFTDGPDADLYVEGESTFTETNSTIIKMEIDFAYGRSIVKVTGQMIEDAKGLGGIGDVFGNEVRRGAIELVRFLNLTLLTGSSSTYDGEASNANGRMLGFQHLLDTDSGDNLYGKSRNTISTLQSGGNDAMSGATITFQKLREILTTVEENGANRGDMVFIFSPQQRDKYLQQLQSMGQLPQPTTPIAGFNTTNYQFDDIPIFVDKDMTAAEIFLVDRENTRLAIQLAPTLTEFGIVDDARKAFIKTYFNLYCRKPKNNYKLTGLSTS